MGEPEWAFQGGKWFLGGIGGCGVGLGGGKELPEEGFGVWGLDEGDGEVFRGQI